MVSQNKSELCSSSVKIFSPISPFPVPFGKRLPSCPYMEGYLCGAFDFRFKSSVCCNYSNSFQLSYDDVDSVDVYRCCWLPSWVKNGFHEAKFYNGVLHGERF